MSKAGATNRNLNLTAMEEGVIIQYIMQLDSQGFLPQCADVENMANILLAKRNREVSTFPPIFPKIGDTAIGRFQRKVDFSRDTYQDRKSWLHVYYY
jgi:hypothetical protein